jgi:hypothetical protein
MKEEKKERKKPGVNMTMTYDNIFLILSIMLMNSFHNLKDKIANELFLLVFKKVDDILFSFNFRCADG